MKTYLANNVLANQTEAAVAREFIAKQLPKTEATVSQAEAALRRFKEKNNVAVLEEEASSSVERIADLEDQVDQAQAELEAAKADSQVLRNKLEVNSQQARVEDPLASLLR